MELVKLRWDEKDYEELVQYLLSLADEKYRSFNSKLVPDTDNIIGIRMPILRKIGKDICKGDIPSFLLLSGTTYFEEIMLKGIIIGLYKTDYETFIEIADNFIPLINNWAICDCFCNGLKQVKNYKPDFFEHILKYLNSEEPFEIRVGLILMLSYYIEDYYVDEVIRRCDCISFRHYYVRMAQAWLISIIYIKYPKKCNIYLEYSNLDNWTYNKSIQKIRESHCIDKETKAILNKMKRK